MADNENETPKTVPLDQDLKGQLEASLAGVYRFNTTTAKYGVIWVWLLRLLTFCMAAAAMIALGIFATLAIMERDIEVSPLDPFRTEQTFLYLGAAFVFAIGFAFFRSVLRGISIAVQSSVNMAEESDKK